VPLISLRRIRQAALPFLLICLFVAALSECVFASNTAKEKYFKADAAYKKLQDNYKIKKYRHNWIACIKKYNAVHKYDESGKWAAAGLYKSGLLYFELYKFSNKSSDLKKASKIFNKVIKSYPKSEYRKRAEIKIDKIDRKLAKKETSTTASSRKNRKLAKKETSTTASSRKKLIIPGLKCIVIDPGHGGKDNGAPGYNNGVKEKTITLDMALKLAKQFRKNIQCKVILTREDDRFLTLDERTQIADRNNADLFISIHTNASKNRSAHGTETYILSHSTDKEAARVAARENNTTVEQVSDLQLILSSLIQNSKINESTKLASYVEESIYKKMKKDYKNIKSKGVKQAPFHVLIGAHMPSILIELGFISNSMECKRLIDPEYQDKLCMAILNGIKKYVNGVNPAAYTNRKPNSPKG
jgi:N-acetylmuramoyl-L-alanine amidase